ncbi:thiamine-phosphate kinase [Lysobacter pythonis]|uniref:Thiamine-monophosphate kinase n=1 Tax=Solilutibacter pythonis TaxID=2483112 RepID=A0A3M2HYR3_9GAMM|nr:thiamine-phosphate kinase [Lysobacter pythonis]RMH94208.1 thiamine-phosphate kinase [Lysobacter pythonis]
MAEFDLIERIRVRAARRGDVPLGIGDDAALVAPPPGIQLAIATDTLNVGVHFPPETAAFDIGWKALAVNLSDLAAMGAEPAWASLSLSLPESDVAWLDAFLDGFGELAARHGVALIGGDTTRGPLSVCVNVVGFVAPGRAMRRDAARVGDEVWVSGTLGDAAAALSLWRAGRDVPPALRERLDRPVPRIALGHALAGIAHAGIDVSDGVLADLGHVAAASGVRIEVETGALPASSALAAFDVDTRRHWQATGGDDYELCFSAPPEARGRVEALAARMGVRVSRIGRVGAGAGVRAFAGGEPWVPARTGYAHFSG